MPLMFYLLFFKYKSFWLPAISYINRIASMLTSNALDRGIKTLSGQTKDYTIGICYFSV